MPIYTLNLATGTLLILLALSTAAYGQGSSHPAANLPVPQSHFTESEFRRAARLGAEEAFGMRLSSVDSTSIRGMTVLSSVESVDDNSPDSRLALVTSYSYDRGATIRRVVDLANNAVVTEHVTDDSSAPLAEIEKSIVHSLVLQDRRIAELLGDSINDIAVEMLLTSSFDPDDRFFRKRVVLALLKTPQGYARNLPKIYVNLSDSTVVVGE